MPASITIVPEGFKEAEKALAGIKNGYPTVAVKAINRSLITGRKVVAQAVAARYNIKSGDVKSNITDRKATKSHLGGELELKGAMLPLTLFKPSGGQVLKSGKRKVIKAAIRKGQTKEFRQAFKIPGGKIMERRQDARLPIFPIFTIGVPFMAGQANVSEKVETEMARTAAVRLEHETNRLLEQKGFKMSVYELEDALVEFCAQNTSELRFRSNEQSEEMIAPQVYSGFIPRDEVGAIIPGDTSVYPAIIVSAQSGVQQGEKEVVTVAIAIGCFDAELDQQGYKDCMNIVQRLKDRFREIDIIRDSFALSKGPDFLLNWQLNKRSFSMNAFPYYFGELQVNFDVAIMETQFAVMASDGEFTPGRYNEYPIPSGPQVQPLQSQEK